MQIKPNQQMRRPGCGAPWPIIESHSVSLRPADMQALNVLRVALLQEHAPLGATWFEQMGVRAGWCDHPSLYIEDHRSISRLTDEAAKRFEYRMLGLAGPDDGALVSAPPDREFEAYIETATGHEAPLVLPVEAGRRIHRRRLANDALNTPETFGQIVQLARRGGGLNLVPYISSGDVWVLASRVAQETGLPVCVTAPPPTVSALANDKLWFTRMARRLIGVRAVPLTREVYSLSDLAKTVRDMVEISTKLVFKLPASAGGLGNISFDAAPFRGLGLGEIAVRIRAQLQNLGWRSGDKLLVGRWDADVSASPSVQIWVPDEQQGNPLIEGVFMQVVTGQEGAFVGAQRADLPAATTDALTYQSMQIAILLQGLGYVGRLSLDAVLLGDQSKVVDIHWIEANARWGGVSIPMTLAHKLEQSGGTSQLAIAQHHLGPGAERTIAAIQKRFEAQRQEKGFDPSETAIFLVPPSTGLALIVGLATTATRAHDLTQIAFDACT